MSLIRNRTIENAIDVLRWEGIQGAVARSLAVLGHQRIGCYRHTIRTSMIDPPGKAQFRIELVELSNDHSDTYCRFRKGARKSDFLERIRNNNRCFILLVDKQPVTASWIGTGAGYLSDIDLTIPLREDEIYLWDSYTLKPHRGHGWQSVLFHLIMKSYSSTDITTVTTMIEHRNKANIWSGKKRGFRLVGQIISFRLGRFKRRWYRGRCRSYSKARPEKEITLPDVR